MAKNLNPTGPGVLSEGPSEVTPLLGTADIPDRIVEQNDGTAIGGDNDTATTNAQQTTANDEDQNAARPMRTLQILLLCYASLAEPVAYFSIFPYVNEMIERTGEIAPENVGFWTGLIESLFSLVQMLLMIIYGRMADRFGRKPVLVFSLAGVSFATALFGLSASLWQMILFRMVAGLFSGSAVTIRTMVSENCDKSTQGRAFSWYMFARNLGILIGPICGGALANPAQQFPGTIGRVRFFIDFPYALPALVAGAISLSTTLAAALYLKETLKTTPDGSKEPPMSTWEVVKSPNVPMVLYIFGHVMLMGLAYTAVNPVFLYTKVDKGGLGFQPWQITVFLATAGASQALWMLLAFPFLQKRLGTGNLLRITAVGWPSLMVIYPVLNELLRHDLTTTFWFVSIPMLVLGSGVAMSFACVQLCVNDVSPSPHVLATVNGLALTVNTAIRGVAPISFSSIFAAGVKLGWLDGHLFWVVITILGLLLNVAVYFLPAAAEGRPEQQTSN